MAMATLAAKRRERAILMERKRAQREKEAVKLFGEVDGGGGSLDKAALKLLLEKMNPSEPPTDDGVDYVHHSIFPENPDGQVGVCHMGAMNKHYHYWSSKSDDVDKIFADHDADESGYFDRDQFKKALIAIEEANADKRAYDAGDWTTTIIQLTDELFDKVTEFSDWNENGRISKPEALAAMTLWSAIAKEEARRKSTSCLIA